MRYGKLIEGHPASYWSKKSNIPTEVIYMRYFKLKWSLDRILKTPQKGIDFGGRHYRSMTELCKTYGKNLTTVQARMKKGLSLGEALAINRLPDPRKQRTQEEICGHVDCFTCPFNDCIYPD